MVLAPLACALPDAFRHEPKFLMDGVSGLRSVMVDEDERPTRQVGLLGASVAVRVIPRLDVDNGRVGKGVKLLRSCVMPAIRSSLRAAYDAAWVLTRLRSSMSLLRCRGAGRTAPGGAEKLRRPSSFCLPLAVGGWASVRCGHFLAVPGPTR